MKVEARKTRRKTQAERHGMALGMRGLREDKTCLKGE